MNSAVKELRWALARTALLVQRDFFPSLTQADIADGLAELNVRIVSDAENLESPAAQTAVVATAIVLVQSGAGVILDIPDVPMAASQPPLADGAAGLATVLNAHLDRLPAHRIVRSPLTPPDLVLLIGDTPLGQVRTDHTAVVRSTGDSWSASIFADPGPLSRWSGRQPFGGILSACAVGGEAFRLAIRKLSERSHVQPLSEHRLTPSAHIRVAVAPIDQLPAVRRRIDFVSGGAITNAAMFTLQRVPGFTALARVFDDDTVQLSNLNRYPMFGMDELDIGKVEALADASPPGWAIEPVPLRLNDTTIHSATPLAPQVLVGVDDIPSRWRIQRHATDWLCVAGTSHFEVVVSEHTPGGPCAGCMHPQDDPSNDAIPTVAFVSLLAGVLQAHRLVSRIAGSPPTGPVVAWALGLDGEHGIHPIGQSPRADCPVHCDASASLSRAANANPVGQRSVPASKA